MFNVYYYLFFIFIYIFYCIYLIAQASVNNEEITVNTAKIKPICEVNDSFPISFLTSKENVTACIVENHEIPRFYINKEEAKKKQFRNKLGNLCDACPGFAIGGDIFLNKEEKLPEGQLWMEYDVDFHCDDQKSSNYRNGNRLVVNYPDYSQIWYTSDHYGTFTQIV